MNAVHLFRVFAYVSKVVLYRCLDYEQHFTCRYRHRHRHRHRHRYRYTYCKSNYNYKYKNKLDFTHFKRTLFIYFEFSHTFQMAVSNRFLKL